MSTELAIGITVAAFVLMAGIVLGLAAVALLDAVVVWPPRPAPSFGEQMWVRSTQTDTAAMPIAGWTR
ncbi:MAG TPA: hypothetical protein VFS51_05215 [Gemmatimonadales bacterium]|nr:hypothetical protein [Gemmatimonadales bacterium]